MSPVSEPAQALSPDALVQLVREGLGPRAIVLVGLMGAGKSSIGKRLAQRLSLPFADVDSEIEAAANATIAEIFERNGEAFFREGERRVLSRLLDGSQKVLATGGGAFLPPESRAAIKQHGVSIWLQADLDVLMARVRRRSNRPLLRTEDPEAVMRKLMDERDPIYALADIHIRSREVAHETVMGEILEALANYFDQEKSSNGPVMTNFSHASLTRVGVDLGARAYDILIGAGLIAQAGREIVRCIPGTRAAIVTDETVAGLHLSSLSQALSGAGIEHATITVPPGESSKSFGCLERVVDGILAARLERGDVVIALGGGVVGDLAGFAAGIVRRGMHLVQIPTSLLAQVDSSVGGKTGIDTPRGKNLVGVFHQPRLVLIDTATLETLSARHKRAGYAEIAKYGLINDAPFFTWLEENWRGVFGGGKERDHAIATSCRAKAAVVAADERESGERALLNLGHTFGHALEAATGYSDLLVHGEAVAIGIVLAHQFSAKLGLCPPEEADRVEAHFAAAGLPISPKAVPGPALDPGSLLALMAQDKKVERGRLTFILTRGIGKAFVARDVSSKDVRAFLEDRLRS